MKEHIITTLCYLERDNKYLMLHRIKKDHDINKDKWIGVGGHLEDNESPEECIKREIFEETGFDIALEDLKFRAVITFVSGCSDYELMCLFTAKSPEGEPMDCDEGELVWVDKKDIFLLNLWEGDKIFLDLLDKRDGFFSLKLVYDNNGKLVESVLDGRAIPIKSDD